MHNIYARLFGTLLLLTATISGQQRITSPAERYRMFQHYLEFRGQQITAKQPAGVHDLAEWNKKRPQLRRELLFMLGLDPLPAKTPLRAAVTGQFERERFRVEKVVFQSMLGLYVTGDLYLPKTTGRNPAVIYLCGH